MRLFAAQSALSILVNVVKLTRAEAASAVAAPSVNAGCAKWTDSRRRLTFHRRKSRTIEGGFPVRMAIGVLALVIGLIGAALFAGGIVAQLKLV
jgi:hypothetical protein